MQRHGGPVAVAYMDLDGFKAINDTHGHEVGDAVLAGLAEHLRGAVRRDELGGRIGGDEFVVVATEGLAQDEAACRLGEAVALPIATPGESAESVLRRADQAMFAVKRSAVR